jgi:hypothetical protein
VWPDTRVQRTRSSPSALRSPLTRYPLGRGWCGGRLATVVAGVVAVAGVTLACHSAQPTQPATPASLELLTGEWVGTVGTRQAGECSIFGPDLADNEGRMPGRVVDDSRMPITVLLKVESDGRLKGWEKVRQDAVLDETKPRWVGTVNKDLQVWVVKRSEPVCDGHEREAQTDLKGQVSEGQPGDSLEVSGREYSCPSMGCSVELTYRLTRRSQ